MPEMNLGPAEVFSCVQSDLIRPNDKYLASLYPVMLIPSEMVDSGVNQPEKKPR